MGGTLLTVRVTPRSNSDCVIDAENDVLRVRVTAPPADGRANAAVCRVVADAIGVPKSHVQVVRGHASKTKVVSIEGATEEQVGEALRAACRKGRGARGA